MRSGWFAGGWRKGEGGWGGMRLEGLRDRGEL